MMRPEADVLIYTCLAYGFSFRFINLHLIIVPNFVFVLQFNLYVPLNIYRACNTRWTYYMSTFSIPVGVLTLVGYKLKVSFRRHICNS